MAAISYIYNIIYINSLNFRGAWICFSVSSLVSVMAWHLFGAKPLPKPMMNCTFIRTFDMKFYQRYKFIFLENVFENIWWGKPCFDSGFIVLILLLFLALQEVLLHRETSEEKVGLTLCYGAADEDFTDIFISEVSGVIFTTDRDGRWGWYDDKWWAQSTKTRQSIVLRINAKKSPK